MNISELKRAWEQQKVYFEDLSIPEKAILRVIQKDLNREQQVRRVLYNASSFMLLITLCQTC
ncbi:hypothetical protein J2Y45_006684 [Dyadobacter sp. BE34]|uniref:Uncharacterized protein n=1 Tax=Dyadobacter fermentans TaxID=94254 RepID=A0ABU1R874_9BACT|nr:hypothetical protein [Dyadobacter fermentans]MDR7047284.1 hypothetical protein [Dyadobacter sp. BE242]MDR7201520.1 hypothetical protein [Dyadobacter sp. BE34]MDR7219390.1 hypothetical protein [Dyadobacter sp. BE31]MDR7267216.1 hypothetical protein [Dyadobacter sp. BE32]